MTRLLTPDEIEAAAQTLIAARTTNLGIEVSVPVIYPNGEAVTVVVTVDDGDYLVHDGGFGTMYLTSVGQDLTKSVAQRLAVLASNYGCDFINGRMLKRCSADHLAVAIAMVANASRTVGDQALESRRPSEQRDFSVVVTDVVHEAFGQRVRERETIKGASGAKYRVANVILDSHQSRPIAFVESFSSRTTIGNHYMEFDDLHRAFPDVRNLSVCDENEQFRKSDFAILKRVSEVYQLGQSRKVLREMASR